MWLDSSAHPKHLPKKTNPCPQDRTGTIRRPEFGCREFGEFGGPAVSPSGEYCTIIFIISQKPDISLKDCVTK